MLSLVITNDEKVLTIANVMQRSSFPALCTMTTLVNNRSPVANAANEVKAMVTPSTALPGACPETAILVLLYCGS